MNILIKTDGTKIELDDLRTVNLGNNIDKFTCRVGGLVGLCDRDALFNGEPYNKEATRITGIGIFGDVILLDRNSRL